MRYLISIPLIAITYFLILLGALYMIDAITLHVTGMLLTTVLHLSVTAIIAYGMLNLSLFVGNILTPGATLGNKVAGITLVFVGAIFLWRYHAVVDETFLPILGTTAFIPFMFLFANFRR